MVWVIPTLLLFGIKNKYKKRDITSQILYHVIDPKKHERIGFMSHNNCILTLLDLKDKKSTLRVRLFELERVKRIELSQSAWKAEVLPLNYTRI